MITGKGKIDLPKVQQKAIR